MVPRSEEKRKRVRSEEKKKRIKDKKDKRRKDKLAGLPGKEPPPRKSEEEKKDQRRLKKKAYLKRKREKNLEEVERRKAERELAQQQAKKAKVDKREQDAIRKKEEAAERRRLKKQLAKQIEEEKRLANKKKFHGIFAVAHPPTFYRHLSLNPHDQTKCQSCLDGHKCQLSKPIKVIDGLKKFVTHGIFGNRSRSRPKSAKYKKKIRKLKFGDKLRRKLKRCWPDLAHGDDPKFVKKELRKHCRHIYQLYPRDYASFGLSIYKKYCFRGLLKYIRQEVIANELEVISTSDGWTGININDLIKVVHSYKPFNDGELMILLHNLEGEYYLSEVRMAVFRDGNQAPRPEPVMSIHKNKESKVEGYFPDHSVIYLMLE